MTQKTQRSLIVAVSLFTAVLVGSMYVRHTAEHTKVSAVHAAMAAPAISDQAIARALGEANVPLDRITVRNAGGIAIVLGNADPATTARAIGVVNALGFTRVANLVKEQSFDDESLRRAAERQLAQSRSLDGCLLKVSCLNGVIHVSGTIHNDLQEDVARNVLRGVEGAHEVKVELKKI